MRLYFVFLGRVTNPSLKVLVVLVPEQQEPSNLTLATDPIVPLVRAYHHIEKLHYAIRPYVEISAPRARTMYIVGP